MVLLRLLVINHNFDRLDKIIPLGTTTGDRYPNMSHVNL